MNSTLQYFYFKNISKTDKEFKIEIDFQIYET